jgi:hypothetical protein
VSFCDDWRCYYFWGLSLDRGDTRMARSLEQAAEFRLQDYNTGGEGGRFVFELGSVLERVPARPADKAHLPTWRCIELYHQWSALAKGAIECWIVVGRRLGIARDVRRIVAELLWEQRASWSEHRL